MTMLGGVARVGKSDCQRMRVARVGKSDCQRMRALLENLGIYDNRRKVTMVPGTDRADLPILPPTQLNTSSLLSEFPGVVFAEGSEGEPVKEGDGEGTAVSTTNNLEKLDSAITAHLTNSGLSLPTGYLPRAYQTFGDLLLLPADSLHLPTDIDQGNGEKKITENLEEILDIICDIFRVKRIARKNPVLDDKFRSPRTDMLRGTNPWVAKKENGIIYNFNITKCMFSQGNISEKMRLAKLDCSEETVVDLFAGIGYFVLPYLVHAKAKHVYACEWNPHSVEALVLNLRENKVSERCTVLAGDNREVCPTNVADRVNLGLIPSSELSWRTACRALKPTGGILHIHQNIQVKPGEEREAVFSSFSKDLEMRIKALVHEVKPEVGGELHVETQHVERVKSYGPRIYHVVLDLRCWWSEPTRNASH